MDTSEQAMFGKYRLLGRLSEGGMGVIYHAQHTMLGHEAAIKILPLTLASDPSSRQWFTRGAASAAGLNHPNILPVWEYGEEEGHLYLAMPLIRGGTLKDRMLAGPVAPAKIIGYLRQAAAALDFAHGHGIVHRDVKPQNILIEVINGEDHLFLADFGIAKALESSQALTRTGSSVGTPEYMAPEQAQGRADTRSDLYALGIILYQLLTGKVPYSGTTAVEVLMKHLQDPMPEEPLRQVRPALPGAIAMMLQRALAKNPDERFQTGQALVDGFLAALNERDTIAQLTAMTMPTPDVTVSQLRLAQQPTQVPTFSSQPNPALGPTALAPVVQTPIPATQQAMSVSQQAMSVSQQATPFPHDTATGRTARRNPLFVGLAAVLSVALVGCLGIGGAGAILLRPTPAPVNQQVALILPTATPTATPLPPTPTATVTSRPSPRPSPSPSPGPPVFLSPTVVPSPTPQPSPSPTTRPSPAPSTAPYGARPAGFSVYEGNARFPFSIYYPTGWTIEVDEENDEVTFSAPDGRTWFSMFVTAASSDANINGLRDEYKRAVNAYCIENEKCSHIIDGTTGNDTIGGATFAWQTLGIQFRDGSTRGNRAGEAVKNGYHWHYSFISPGDSFGPSVQTFLLPALRSLNIYATPAER